MEIVYVACRFSFNSSDRAYYINQANEIAKDLYQKGYIPIVPYKLIEDWEDDERFYHLSEEDWFTSYLYPLLNICDAVVVSSYDDEEDVDNYPEVKYARRMNIPVYTSEEV